VFQLRQQAERDVAMATAATKAATKAAAVAKAEHDRQEEKWRRTLVEHCPTSAGGCRARPSHSPYHRQGQVGTCSITHLNVLNDIIIESVLFIFLKIRMVAGKRTIFSPPGSLPQTHIKV
jgi:hypothetical protein